MDENLKKYLPYIISGLSFILGISNNRKINHLNSQCYDGFKMVADEIQVLKDFKHTSFGNFKILHKDINKLGNFVGFKGRLGINE